MLVAVPTGIKIFNWLGTMYGGKIRFGTPMLFCTAFLFQFLCAGLTGIMLAVVPVRLAALRHLLRGGHFHFVLIGGLVFTVFAAIYYWFPKATGRMLSERLGAGTSGCSSIGFNLTFVTMHIPGLLGMPRRIYTYDADRGWEIWNQVTTLGRASLQIARRRRSSCEHRASRCGGARPPGTTPGTPGRWNGRRRSPPPPTTSRSCRGLEPAAPVGPEAPRRPGLGLRMSARDRPRPWPTPGSRP